MHKVRSRAIKGRRVTLKSRDEGVWETCDLLVGLDIIILILNILSKYTYPIFGIAFDIGFFQVPVCGGYRPQQVDSGEPSDPEEPLATRRGDPQLESVRNPFRALQAGRDLDRCQSQLHLRLSRQDHLHLPHEVQRFPNGHTEVQVSGRRQYIQL